MSAFLKFVSDDWYFAFPMLLMSLTALTVVIQQIQASNNAPEYISAIGLALFATALGLVTAIPLVFSHVLFKAWIVRFEVRMKSAAQKLLLLIQANES